MANNEANIFINNLSKYIGISEACFIEKITQGQSFILKITKHRNTKFGDYKPSFKNNQPRITINGNLNKFSFIITLLHELAHFNTFKKSGSFVKPHGAEWKTEFKRLLNFAFDNQIFPKELKDEIINNYFINDDYSYTAHSNIINVIDKILNNINIKKLEDFQVNSNLLLKNGMKIKIIEKKRTRYLCKCINNNRMYYVQRMAEVVSIL